MHDGVFYCMPHSSSVLLSSLATIAGHSLISTQRYRYNCGRLKSYFFFFRNTTFREKTFISPVLSNFKIELRDSLDLKTKRRTRNFDIFNSIAKSCLRKTRGKEFTNCSTVTIERRSRCSERYPNNNCTPANN